MMKKIYLPFLFLIFSQSLFATHIIGGSMTYEYLGGDEYKIKVEVLRDCINGIPPFDDAASFGFFDENNMLLMDTLVAFEGSDTLTLAVPNSVCVYPPSVCIERTYYEFTVELPALTGGYTVAYQRCCRAHNIVNLVAPEDAGMTFHTKIQPDQQNSSPQFNYDTPFAVFVNTPFVYDASAFDPDGDSLVYKLTYPFHGGSDSIPRPQPPNPPPFDTVMFMHPPYSVDNMLGGNYPLKINSQTGEISAIPSIIGSYQIAYAIKEFRNGVHIGTTYREFNFVVINQIMGQNYNVSGEVLVDGVTPLDLGKVQVMERDITTDSLFLYEEQAIGVNGVYDFTDIPPGVFYMKAVVDSASMYFGDYLPTYYNSTLFWYDAFPVNQCDTSQFYRDIHLVHADSLTGDFVLEGYISLPDFNSGYPPVAGLDLILGNDNGEFFQARQTDSDGFFRFENLAEGTYEIYVDLINSNVDNSFVPTFVVDDENNFPVQLYLYDSFLSTDIPLSNSSISTEKIKVSTFPNPAKDQLWLEINLEYSAELTAQIFNVYGQHVSTIFENRIFAKGESVVEVSLNGLAKGTYFLEIQHEEGRGLKKIMRQ